MVFQEADLPVRVIGALPEQFDGHVDDEKAHHRLVSFFTRTSPELLDRLELYKGKAPLFEKQGIEDVIKTTLSRRVDLPSGGYLMIDYAEALTVIDVNSGSFTGRGKGARLRKRSRRRIWRPPRRPSASCGCVISAASSSSTSSTCRARATARRS